MDYPRLADNPCSPADARAQRPLLEQYRKPSQRGGFAAADVRQLLLLFDRNPRFPVKV